MNQKNYKELRFTDDFMFCKIMLANKDICKEVVELLLGCKVKDVVYLEEQKNIKITFDGKGIRLDVYLEDGNTVYDIEMQTILKRDLAKRARYYQGMIDLNLIEQGAAYSELKESFVVFICLEDLFKRNRSIYTFKNCCLEERDLLLDDAATKVFVNAGGDRKGLTPAQIAFLDYVAGKDPSDGFTERLNREVIRAREKEEWEVEYMTLLQRDREKYEEGRTEGIISLLMDGIISEDIAAARLNKTPEELAELMQQIKK